MNLPFYLLALSGYGSIGFEPCTEKANVVLVDGKV